MFISTNLKIGRANFNDSSLSGGPATHLYVTSEDTLNSILSDNYFPPYLGSEDSAAVAVNDIMNVYGINPPLAENFFSASFFIYSVNPIILVEFPTIEPEPPPEEPSFYVTGYIVSFFVDYGVINSVPTKYAIDGFIGLEDQTIGNEDSAAVEANNQYQNLFMYLWESISNANCPVSGGRGISALADWEANKTINLPLTQGRVTGNQGTGAGLSARVLGETFGEENHQLTVAELASHSHNVIAYEDENFATNDQITYDGANLSVSSTYPSVSTGDNIAHNTMQPTTFLYYYIKY